MKTFSYNNIKVFVELLRAGLWVKEARLSQFKDIDYNAIMIMAEEQSVVGLVTAGLEGVRDVKVPKEKLLQFVGITLQIEQQNKAMNAFVVRLIELLRRNNIYSILVKGQGIAQCYECPLWRSSGDVDLLLSNDDYEKAKILLRPLSVKEEREFKSLKHLALTMKEGFVVELHGALPSRLSKRVDLVIDNAQHDVFYHGSARSWINGETTIFLPSHDSDVIFVFTHILKHFYIEGIGLRQICDWCRLLWVYRDGIDVKLLEKRLAVAGIMNEWRAFAALAVDWLGMPARAMPLYESKAKWSRKANRIMEFVLETGNFGHNRGNINRSSFYFIGKVQAVWYKMRDFARHARIFFLDSVVFFFHYVKDGVIIYKEGVENGASNGYKGERIDK